MSAVSPDEVARDRTETVEGGRPTAAELEQSALTRLLTVGLTVLLVLVEVAWLALLAYAVWRLLGVL
jgi:hypothetical protein